MKRILILLLFTLGYSVEILLAQKFQPKYLREDNWPFKALTKTATPDGWIEFKKEAKINPNTFFKD